ncbi:hypothetical protein P692DRAFT_201840530 [Suillus brevipes Sb2]|nr:hypothetical protein P692DRAFT_201840530 [Suillus brevipes Sb2]
MLKWAGWGYDPAGVKSTGSSECAVLCPACPQPSKNLPMIDTNFRLKRRIVSKDSVDPGLSRGCAYFVEETAYKTYLQTHSGIPQQHMFIPQHSEHAATGVETIDCARHNMKLPNGVGNLQKDKRYTNIDYLFFSTLRGCCIDTLNVSYNIACQWHKNLWERMSAMLLNLHLDHLATFVRFFVPKFYLPAHILKCQTKFSFNFSRNIGRTDGEAPECRCITSS